ncbi:hypothetical protein DNTS_023089 [Danionella cerebrum]|uniref:Parathyroid hormone n=1 Tax=Danionella cerebrum TaxID=2873325 RepID=A0A553QSM0_9TELE|nr:hypothetical protein DNTS_023089 [Danionella translucida]
MNGAELLLLLSSAFFSDIITNNGATHQWAQRYKRRFVHPPVNRVQAEPNVNAAPTTCYPAQRFLKMVCIIGLVEKIIMVAVCILFFAAGAETKPLGKRAINEVQLMHNLGVHKHAELRQDWLQMKLRDIHTASNRNSGSLPEILPKLRELHPAEAEEVLGMLEKLMNPS